jgi:hypothetical protein
MEQDIIIKQKNYERASRLLGELFEVDSDITEQINRCIQHYGASRFFKNLEAFDFSEDVVEKLKAVRMVLFGMGEEDMTAIQKHEEPKGGAKQ